MVSEGFDSGSLTLVSNDFQLFGLPLSYQIDSAVLEDRWKQLQRKVHPDQFASQSAADKRLAMQWSVRVNEAYQRLKHPLRRAAYLCELHGVPIRAEGNTCMPTAFLMQQMQWREALDEANDTSAIHELEQQLSVEKKKILHECIEAMELHSDWSQAAESVRALMFIERFEQDLDNRLEQLENN